MADPTTSKKVLYSAIGTLGISLVLFYLGNRYGEIIIESGRNFFEYYGTAFSKLLPVVAANPLHLSKEPMAMLCGGALLRFLLRKGFAIFLHCGCERPRIDKHCLAVVTLSLKKLDLVSFPHGNRKRLVACDLSKLKAV